MKYILNYFWGIGIIFAAINTIWVKVRMPKTEIEEEKQEQKKILLGYFLFLGILCLLLQIFQTVGNYHSPLYVLYRDFSNIFYWLGVCSIFLFYISCLCFVIKFKNIEKYSQQLFRAELKQKTMILIIIGVIIFGLIIIFGISSFMDIKDEIENIA